LLLFSAVATWVVTCWMGAVSLAAPGVAPVLDAEARLLERMAREGTNVAVLYELGDVCHSAGVDGDKEAVLRGESYLRQLLAIAPTNAPGMALLGSVYTLKGRDAFWPTTQVRLVREGNGYMDRAVDLAPRDVRTRVTRAFNNAHMPDFLGRSDVVIADLQWLWGKVQTEPDSMTLSERQEVALHWGRRLKRQSKSEEARAIWETAVGFGPSTPMARKITAELEKLR
ncbi:MAG: hypothetical protein AB7J34_19745, partial [Limisphaerales bacterium]